MPQIQTEHQSLITLLINGEEIAGKWDTHTPAEAGAEDTSYHEGGRMEPTRLDGQQTVGEATISRAVRRDRGDMAIYKDLLDKRGSAQAVVVEQPARVSNGELIPFGDPVRTAGTLGPVTLSEYTAGNSGPRMLNVTVRGERIR